MGEDSADSKQAQLPATPASRVRIQYEQFPYPPVSWLKLPLLEQTRSLAFESGARLVTADPVSHQGIRILVAGCGTLEPLVIAQQNPAASEIVALDLSHTSLTRLHRRWNVYRAATWLLRRPKLTTVCADFLEWRSGEFDYIIASNFLHHTDDPARGLAHLASMLKPGGLLRLVTYPLQSRTWMREAAALFRTRGIDPRQPGLRARVAEVLLELPAAHPIRSAYRAHPEILTQTGLVDAFFHALENPLSPLAWEQAGRKAGLTCIAEAQDASARSTALDAVAPELLSWPRFAKLELLDCLLELNHNPVLWWIKRSSGVEADGELPLLRLPEVQDFAPDTEPTQVTSRAYFQMHLGVLRAEALLRSMGETQLTADALITRFRAEAGESRFPGLSLGEYDLSEIRKAKTRPWDRARWVEYESRVTRRKATLRGAPLVGTTIADQIEWAQAIYGPRQASLAIEWR